MDRSYIVETSWNELIVPIFIERFLIVVCAAAFYGLVITNTMSLSGLQRVGLGFALTGIALFLGATAYKQAHPPTPATNAPNQAVAPNRTGDSTTNGQESPAVTGNGNNIQYRQPSPPPKKKP